ncbi:DMT family transporter [Desulfosarcina sp.]|uniref:DMT family transporter n=1 Tax=Desulfosarcina sp. TaxID=2027861 RepID=UPI0039708A20
MKNFRGSGLIDIHVAVLLFGTAGLFGKFLCLPAWCIVLGRTGFATIALGCVLFFISVHNRPKGIATIGLFGLLGLVLAVHWITFFHAIQVSSVAVGLLAFSTFPVFITCLEPWWFNEKRRLIDMITALLVVLGLSIMVYPSPFGGEVFAGAFWGTISGFTFAILSLLNRQWVRHYPPVIIAFYQNAAATLLLLPILMGVEVQMDAGQLGLLALLGVVFTALSHALFIRGLTFVRAQLAAVIACLEPVYGIILAYFLLHEIPSAHTLVGGAVILITTLVAMARRALI